MNVHQTIERGNGQSIEIGVASWCTDGENEISIRNRYSTRDGRFNLRASSELPLADLQILICTALDYGLMNKGSRAELLVALARSIQRQDIGWHGNGIDSS